MANNATNSPSTLAPQYGPEVAVIDGKTVVIDGPTGRVHPAPEIEQAHADYQAAMQHVGRVSADAQSALGEFPRDMQHFIQEFGRYDLSGILGPYLEKAGVMQASGFQVQSHADTIPARIQELANAVVSGQSTSVAHTHGSGNNVEGMSKPAGPANTRTV